MAYHTISLETSELWFLLGAVDARLDHIIKNVESMYLTPELRAAFQDELVNLAHTKVKIGVAIDEHMNRPRYDVE